MHDLDEITHLVRADDQVVYADAGYQGVDEASRDHRRRAPVAGRVAGRGPQRGAEDDAPRHDQAIESRKASVRAKVEHPFLIVKRDFGFTKTRYRGLAKNLNQLHMRSPRRTG